MRSEEHIKREAPLLARAVLAVAATAAVVICFLIVQSASLPAPQPSPAEATARSAPPQDGLLSVPTESVVEDRAEADANEQASTSAEASGVLPDEVAAEALAVLRQYKIRTPTRLPTQADWERLTTMVLAMASEIRAANLAIQAVGREIKAERRAAGRFDTYPTSPQPSTLVSDYAQRWPWLAPDPDEWQNYHSYQGKIEVIRVRRGEDVRMDAAQQTKKDLITVLKAGVDRLAPPGD